VKRLTRPEFGQGRKASNAWATRMPMLRTTKNAAMASNIDGSRAIAN
jgi:hypothetical protein